MPKKSKTIKVQLKRRGPAFLGSRPYAFRRDMRGVPVPVDIPKKDATALLERYPTKLELYRNETGEECKARIEREVTANQIGSAAREGYLDGGLDGLSSALGEIVKELGLEGDDPLDDQDPPDEPPAPKAPEGPVDPPTGEGTPVPGDAPMAEPSLADLDDAKKKGGGKKKK